MLRRILKKNVFSHPIKAINCFYRKFATIPQLTQDRFTTQRGNYSELNDKDVAFFESILGSVRVLKTTEDTNSYNIDHLKYLRGNSKLVLKPKSTEEVSAILKYCNEKRLAVCPQGGNTGLLGGSVPVFDEIILSLELLNKIESLDEMTGILVCDSGCILEALDQKANKKGLCMPLDLGAKGSCQIGGNISTNAGGIRLLKFGSLHGSVLGLEAVLANGQIMNLMSNFKKDNTGYHMKHLFIGSEGTLGIVTKVAIQCAQLFQSVHVAFLGLSSFDAVLQTFLFAKRELGGILSACEMIDEDAYRCSIESFNLQPPINHYPFYMLIETSGSNGAHDEEKINNFLTKHMRNGLVMDGTIANEPSKIKKIWEIREKVAVSLINDGCLIIYDISLPLQQFYDIVPITRKRLGSLAKRVCGFGHLGDSNLHLNVSCEEFNQDLQRLLEPFVYEYTAKLRGSISSEHGIGFLKPKYLKYSKSQEAISMMKNLKNMLDPNNILNPYKVLP